MEQLHGSTIKLAMSLVTPARGGNIQHSLQLVSKGPRSTDKNRRTVVDSAGDECKNECRCWFGVQRPFVWSAEFDEVGRSSSPRNENVCLSYQSMWAERSGKISRSSLSSICGSPAHRSVPAPTTSRSRSRSS